MIYGKFTVKLSSRRMLNIVQIVVQLRAVFGTDVALIDYTAFSTVQVTLFTPDREPEDAIRAYLAMVDA